MLIGIFSDVHDHLQNLRMVLDFFKAQKITALIFCGDFCSPFTARCMCEYDITIHAVFGNNDGDRYNITLAANENPGRLRLHGEHAEVIFEEKKIAATHYPLYGKALAQTGAYDLVCSGHTHIAYKENFGTTLWINPGEVMGWKGKVTCGIYNTSNGEYKQAEL